MRENRPHWNLKGPQWRQSRERRGRRKGRISRGTSFPACAHRERERERKSARERERERSAATATNVIGATYRIQGEESARRAQLLARSRTLTPRDEKSAALRLSSEQPIPLRAIRAAATYLGGKCARCASGDRYRKCPPLCPHVCIYSLDEDPPEAAEGRAVRHLTRVGYRHADPSAALCWCYATHSRQRRTEETELEREREREKASHASSDMIARAGGAIAACTTHTLSESLAGTAAWPGDGPGSRYTTTCASDGASERASAAPPRIVAADVGAPSA